VAVAPLKRFRTTERLDSDTARSTARATPSLVVGLKSITAAAVIGNYPLSNFLSGFVPLDVPEAFCD
jgi:hypothetical protein